MAYQQVPGGYMVTPEDGSAPFMIPDSAAQQMGLAGPPGPVDAPSQFQTPGESMAPPYVPPESPGQAPTLGGGQLAPLEAAPAAGSVTPTDVAVPDLKIEDQFIPGTPHETALSPRGSYQLGTGLGIQGLGELSQAQAEEAKAAGRGYDKLAAYNETAAKEAGTAADERFRREQESANFIAMDIAEVKKAGSNLDAGRWYGSRSTGQKFAIFIGAALAGVLNPRGENSMVKLVERQIDQDIQVQMAQLQNKQWAVGQRQNMLQFMMARGANEETARAAAKVYLGQSYMQQMQAEMARTKAPQAIAAGKVAMGEMLKQDGEWTRNLEYLLKEQDMKTQALTMRGGGGGGGGGGKGSADQGGQQGYVEDNKVYFDRTDGSNYAEWKPDSKGRDNAAKFGEKVQGAQSLVNSADELLEMDLNADINPWSADRVAAKAAGARVVMAYMKSIAGVATDKDVDRALAQAPGVDDPKALVAWARDHRKTIEKMRSYAIQDVNTTLQNGAFNPYDKDGKLVGWKPRGAYGLTPPKGGEDKAPKPPTITEHQQVLRNGPNPRDTPESYSTRKVEAIKAIGARAVKVAELSRHHSAPAVERGEVPSEMVIEGAHDQAQAEVNRLEDMAKMSRDGLTPAGQSALDRAKAELAELKRQRTLIHQARKWEGRK